MGYGHLRAASALASALDVPVQCVDEPPLADADEQRLWARARWMYEFVSRASQLPVVGGPFDFALGALTQIPDLYPIRDLSAPTLPVRYLARQVKRGLGRGLVEHLRAEGQPLLTTFYAPAVLADIAGLDQVFCVVTDADVNRIWVPPDVARSRIHYLVPGQRTARRLRSYGVRPAQISLTGFPLPPELLGGRDLPVLKANLAARLARLDPRGAFLDDFRDEVNHFLPGALASQARRAPLITFAVGGAGAQAGLPRRFLPNFRRPLEEGKLRLALVAGVRAEVAARFEEALAGRGDDRPGGRVHHHPEGRRDAGVLPPLQRPAGRDRRAVDQAERDDVLRRIGAAPGVRATGRPARVLQPALGPRGGRGREAARPGVDGRASARLAGRRHAGGCGVVGVHAASQVRDVQDF